MNIPKCVKHNVPMKKSKAIPPALVTMDEGTISEGAHTAEAPLVDVWKCPLCGHSITAG